MMNIIRFILIYFSFFLRLECQKKIREKGESDYPFLVNMWIPKNYEINQEKSMFCDAVQLTPFTDYFFTSAKCFDNLEHGMWLEDIGISWDERIVTYSRHMSFLTRYKEEGGHFVILERFETNPLEAIDIERTSDEEKNHTNIKGTVDDMKKPVEIEDMTKTLATKAAQEMPNVKKDGGKSETKKENKEETTPKTAALENLEEEYEDVPEDLDQYSDLEDQYEINEQIVDDDMKILRSLRNKKVHLSTPDVRGATECYVLGWSTYLKDYDDIKDLEGYKLKKEVVTKVPRKLCKTADPAHICIQKKNDKRDCVEDLGSPLICERKDNKDNIMGVALVGIYTGFRNCVTTETGIFRSLSSELPWIARWARGTPITTSGFPTNKKGHEGPRSDAYKQRRRRRKRRRRRGRGSSHKIYANAFLLIYCYIVLLAEFSLQYN
ncbi:hypothetical protein HHI36_006949 [Cryptolaemus montrouzieri]|uniref:Peptidase S1 domain-containing protein n=1 Tax=Cryptolaemus montrouzieri TaxID=559131 RepID=A0ABD2MN73_9CUCU